MPIDAFSSKQYPYVFDEPPIHNLNHHPIIPLPSLVVYSSQKRSWTCLVFRSKIWRLSSINVAQNFYTAPETFMSFDEDEADYQVFRIAAFITAGRERLTVSEYTDKIDTTPGLAYLTTVC